MHMRDLAMRVRKYAQDIVKDGLRGVVSFIIAFGLLGYAVWNDWNLASVFRFNLDLLHYIGYIPIVGKKVENGLVLIGMDRILFYAELWAFVALILRAVGLGFRVAVWLTRRPFKRWTRTRTRT